MLMTDCFWEVGRLPFYWKPLQSPINEEGLPDTLPFALVAHPETGLLQQVLRQDVSAALKQAYLSGSMITGQMDQQGIGRQYAEDFLDFF